MRYLSPDQFIHHQDYNSNRKQHENETPNGGQQWADWIFSPNHSVDALTFSNLRFCERHDIRVFAIASPFNRVDKRFALVLLSRLLLLSNDFCDQTSQALFCGGCDVRIFCRENTALIVGERST